MDTLIFCVLIITVINIIIPFLFRKMIKAYLKSEEKKNSAICFDKEIMEEILKHSETSEETTQTYEPQVDLSAYPTREEVLYMIESLKHT